MKWVIVFGYVFSVLYVHFRGKVRLPLFRQLFDHSSVVSPVNLFFYGFSKLPSQPYYAVANFPELHSLEQHWQDIRTEALNLQAIQKIKAAEKNDDAGFNSFFKTGWKRFYLKWYNAAHPSALALCPKTVALLNTMPCIKAAMFAELPPGAKLNKHRDPYAGSIRYHLGLVTANSEQCFIEVDGNRYWWKDGESVLFDETYIHWAQNNSDVNRIILFCDVERPMQYRWAQAVNRWIARHIMTAASSPNETGDFTGLINKLFKFAWLIGQYRRKLKKRSKPAYYVLKFGLIIAAIAFIIYL